MSKKIEFALRKIKNFIYFSIKIIYYKIVVKISLII